VAILFQNRIFVKFINISIPLWNYSLKVYILYIFARGNIPYHGKAATIRIKQYFSLITQEVLIRFKADRAICLKIKSYNRSFLLTFIPQNAIKLIRHHAGRHMGIGHAWILWAWYIWILH